MRQALVPPPQRLSVEIGADASLANTNFGASAILSPDGQMLAFVAQGVRAFGPFFSSDGQWVAFFAGAKLRKISVTGGAAVTLCDAPNGRGGACCASRRRAGGQSRSRHSARVRSHSDGRRCCQAARLCARGGGREQPLEHWSGTVRPHLLDGSNRQDDAAARHGGQLEQSIVCTGWSSARD